MLWRRNSQSSPKTFPTKEDVQRILKSLEYALGESDPIYKILIKYVDTEVSLEEQCVAIYKGIGDLLSESKLKDEHLTSTMLNTVQSLKKELEGLNFSRTKDKNPENIFSGYLLRQQLKQFFNQHQNELQTFLRNTQVLLTTLRNFLKEFLKEKNDQEKNDQLIKNMIVLINFVATKDDRKALTRLKFPVYTQCKSEYPDVPNKSGSLEEVLTEIKMNMNDGDIKQLFDCVNKLQVDDDIRFQIVKGILNYLGNQCCGETYVAFIDLLLSSDNAGNAIDKVNEVKNALRKKVRELHQQFDTIIGAISGNLGSVEMNLGMVSGYDNNVKELNDRFEELKYEKKVVDKKAGNGSSRGSIRQLSEEQRKMDAINSKASKLSEDVEGVLTEIVGKMKKRNERLEIIMQMDLSKKIQQLEGFKGELEDLSQQVDIGKLGEQIDELLEEPLHIKYLKLEKELYKMGCDDVKSDLDSLQKFGTKFKEVEQNVKKIKEAIKHKQQLKQIIQHGELLYDQTKSMLGKLEKVQQELVGFIVKELTQIKERLDRYKGDSAPKDDDGGKYVWPALEKKIEALAESLSLVEGSPGSDSLCELSVAIEEYNKVIEILNRDVSCELNSSIDEDEKRRIDEQKRRFTKFWSIEIEKLKRVQGYLLILNLGKLNSLISQLSEVENWLNSDKSFVDSRVDLKSDQIYVNMTQDGKKIVNQTEEHLKLIKSFLQDVIEKIKQMIDALQGRYSEKFDEVSKLLENQHVLNITINTRSKDLKVRLYHGLQQLETDVENLSVEALSKVRELFAEKSQLSFDEGKKHFEAEIKGANNCVTNFVARFMEDHTEDVGKYYELKSRYEKNKQKLEGLHMELYVINAQEEQPKEILGILQSNLSDVIDFGDCERFLQNHMDTLMTTTPRKPRSNPPSEECDKTTTCSLM